jgi:EmrB/QacA subfamily drug resistance transporter
LGAAGIVLLRLEQGQHRRKSAKPHVDTDRQSVLLISTVSVFMTAFMGSSTNIALPNIGRELAMDAVSLGWIAMAFSLAVATFLLPFGRLADILGRKRIYTIGLGIYVIGSTLVGLAISGSMLIGCRIVQGLGGAMMFGTSTAILTSVYPPGERGRVLGINTAAVYTGLSAGPFLGGLMTQYLGWRSIFLIGAALGAGVMGLVFWRLKGEWAEARGEPFDFTGTVIYGLAIVAFMVGMSRLPQWLGFGLLAVGLIIGAGFVRWETIARQPLINMDLFRRNRIFALSNVAALTNYSATAAVGFLLSLYLQYIKGLSPQQAGLVLIAQPTVQAVFSPLTGRLSDTIESRVVASIGMAFTAVGLVFLAFLSRATSFRYIIMSLALLGFGFALFSSPNTNAVMGAVDRRLYGVAASALSTMRTLGMMFSIGVATLVFAVVIGRVQITQQHYDAFLAGVRIAFTIFAVACVAGIFASLARGKMHGNRETGGRDQESAVLAASTAQEASGTQQEQK